MFWLAARLPVVILTHTHTHTHTQAHNPQCDYVVIAGDRRHGVGCVRLGFLPWRHRERVVALHDGGSYNVHGSYACVCVMCTCAYKRERGWVLTLSLWQVITHTPENDVHRVSGSVIHPSTA